MNKELTDSEKEKLIKLYWSQNLDLQIVYKTATHDWTDVKDFDEEFPTETSIERIIAIDSESVVCEDCYFDFVELGTKFKLVLKPLKKIFSKELSELYLTSGSFDPDFINRIKFEINFNKLNYRDYLYLISKDYDCDNLIQRGLAIEK